MEQMRMSENQESETEQKEGHGFDIETAVDTEGGVMRKLGDMSKGTAGKGLRIMTLAAALFGSGMVAKEASAHPSAIPHVYDRAGTAHRVDGYDQRYRYDVESGSEYKQQAMKKLGQGDAYKRAATGRSQEYIHHRSRTDVIIDRIAGRLADEIVDGIWPDEKK